MFSHSRMSRISPSRSRFCGITAIAPSAVDFAAARMAHAGQHFDQLGLPVAVDAGDSRRSRRRRRATKCRRGSAPGVVVEREIFDLQARGSPGCRRAAPRVGLSDDFADHQRGQFVSLGLGGSGVARRRGRARSTVIRSATAIASASLCVISTTMRPSPRRLRSKSRNAFSSRRREHAGGLVENQHARIEAERAQILRAAPARRPSDFRRWRPAGGNSKPSCCRERARPRRDGRESIARPLPRPSVEAAEREIFLPRHPLEQHRALMHRGDSGAPARRAASPPAAARRRGCASPASGASEPASTFISVVLPAPFSPSSA